MQEDEIDPGLQQQLDAAVFQRLISHLRAHPEVQNIDMMITAGFCRNCLSQWWQEEAEKCGIDLNKSESRKIIYGVDYALWKSRHQTEATAEQQEALARRHSAKSN